MTVALERSASKPRQDLNSRKRHCRTIAVSKIVKIYVGHLDPQSTTDVEPGDTRLLNFVEVQIFQNRRDVIFSLGRRDVESDVVHDGRANRPVADMQISSRVQWRINSPRRAAKIERPARIYGLIDRSL